MPTLRDIRGRIVSVQKTQKITRAMKMVAAAKLARAAQAIRAARPYATKIREVLAAVAQGIEADAHPLIAARESVRRLDIVLFTSDRGLCGAYNSNLIKHARARVERRRDTLEAVSLVPIGRRGGEAFRRRGDVEVLREWRAGSSVTPEIAAEIAGYLMQRYREGESDEVVLVYSEFRSALTQTPRDEVLLPVTPEVAEGTGSYEMEPSRDALLGGLVPQAVEFSIFRAMLENQAGEHGARMTAMENATSNTEELIRTLTLDYNKARQAAITAELVEIVGGAEAL